MIVGCACKAADTAVGHMCGACFDAPRLTQLVVWCLAVGQLQGVTWPCGRSVPHCITSASCVEAFAHHQPLCPVFHAGYAVLTTNMDLPADPCSHECCSGDLALACERPSAHTQTQDTPQRPTQRPSNYTGHVSNSMTPGIYRFCCEGFTATDTAAYI